MKSLINWEELQRLFMPGTPSKPQQEQGNMWDAHAKMYNLMAGMERKYTLNQINAFTTLPTDTILDIGCGPGRITVPMAKRAHSVTALDSSRIMLDTCVENVQAEGLNNVHPLFLDWHQAVKGETLQEHDIVICSRSAALHDLKRLSSYARRIAAVVIWANAPWIPVILNRLFSGTSIQEGNQMPLRNTDRRVGYNLMYNIVYDMGFEPNVHIVPDGFEKEFASPEEAYATLSQLREISPGKENIFEKNVDAFLNKNTNGGVTFRIETRSAVIWWETHPQTYDHIWNNPV